MGEVRWRGERKRSRVGIEREEEGKEEGVRRMKVSNEDGKEGSKEGEKDKRAGPVCYPPV